MSLVIIAPPVNAGTNLNKLKLKKLYSDKLAMDVFLYFELTAIAQSCIIFTSYFLQIDFNLSKFLLLKQ